MDEIVCHICNKEYQDNDNAACPKVLNCGHTFCSTCISQVLGTSKLCQQRGVKSLRTKYEELDEIYSKCVKELKSNMTYIENHHKMIKSGLTRIDELMNSEGKVADVDLTLAYLNSQLEDILGSNILNKCNFRNSYSPSICDFSDPNDFLLGIYKRAQTGEQFYAVTNIDDEQKFALLSVREENLLIHAFGQPPKDGAHFNIVNEIKKSLKKGNYFPFLEIDCNDNGIRKVIIIQTVNSSLLPRFLKFCTGEEGQSYKGASCCKGDDRGYGQDRVTLSSVMQVDKLSGRKSKTVDGLYYRHFSYINVDSIYPRYKIIVLASMNGSFNIYQVVDDSHYSRNVVGTVGNANFPAKLIEHGDNRKVIDSGIAINVYAL